MAKVRYGVVGAGWISQVAFMPGAAQTDNSTVTAIVTGNAGKARKLAEFYGVEHIYTYDSYDEMLASGHVDAVYIALPNSMHAGYAIRAARAGIHALVEKPLAVSVEECEAMIAAAEAADTRLMTAYRLHHEPCSVEVLEMIRRGEIGTPRLFSSVFSNPPEPGNHRLKAEHWGGAMPDLGIYCLNAARHVFGAEPVEAIAMAARTNAPRLREVDEMVSATLRFPSDAIATFTASFAGDAIDTYRIVGTEGEIEVTPGFHFQTGLKARLTRGGKITEREFPQIDQFGAQTAYFSDCIVKGARPEADGEEGLADVRALLAIDEAARTGRPVGIDTPPRPSHPTPNMVRNIPPTDRRLVL